MTTPERSLTGANRGNGDKNLCSLRSLLSNSGCGVVEIDFNHANSEGVNIYRRRDGDADFKFLAFGAEVGPRRARDTAPSFYNNPTIQQSMNPFRLAVFVVGDVEVSQFSDEIIVDCAPMV